MKIYSLEDVKDAIQQLRCEIHFLTDNWELENDFCDHLYDAEDVVKQLIELKEDEND